MPKFEGYDMPESPEMEGNEEELDLFADEEMEEEEAPAGELSSFSDEDLIAEMEARGFEIEPEEELEAEELSEESEEEPSMF